MATQKIGKIVPLFKGAYDATALYDLNDIVMYEGVMYWHTSMQITKGVVPTNDSVWTAMFEIAAFAPVFKGEYSSETEYQLNNIVTSENSLYWHIGAEATTDVGVDNSTVWALVIQGPII